MAHFKVQFGGGCSGPKAQFGLVRGKAREILARSKLCDFVAAGEPSYEMSALPVVKQGSYGHDVIGLNIMMNNSYLRDWKAE